MKALPRALAIGALILGVLATLAISRQACGGRDWPSCWDLWAVGPYVAHLALCAAVRRRAGAAWVAAVGALVTVAFGVGVLVDGFFVHLGAQSAILFVFVPLWQWAGFGLFALISTIAARRSKRP